MLLYVSMYVRETKKEMRREKEKMMEKTEGDV